MAPPAEAEDRDDFDDSSSAQFSFNLQDQHPPAAAAATAPPPSLSLPLSLFPISSLAFPPFLRHPHLPSALPFLAKRHCWRRPTVKIVSRTSDFVSCPSDLGLIPRSSSVIASVAASKPSDEPFASPAPVGAPRVQLKYRRSLAQSNHKMVFGCGGDDVAAASTGYSQSQTHIFADFLILSL